MSNPLVPVLVPAAVVFVVMPLLSALWKALTRPPVEAVPMPEGFGVRTAAEAADPQDAARAWWEQHHARFVSVQAQNGSVTYLDAKHAVARLREAILDGRQGRLSSVRTHVRDDKGAFSTHELLLEKYVRGHFALDVLYRPVRAHALAGLKWGALAGVALKLLDTGLGLLVVEPGAALCFLVAVALCFVPRVGLPAVIVGSIVLGQFYRANFFLMGMAAAFAGALLGCLPGMAIGGIVGLLRQERLRRAPDAPLEEGNPAVTSFLLPAASAVVLHALYFLVVNPWLTRTLTGQPS